MYVIMSIICDYEHDEELRGIFDNLSDVQKFFSLNEVTVNEHGNFCKIVDTYTIATNKVINTYEFFTVYDIELNKQYVENYGTIPMYEKECDINGTQSN